MSPACVMPTVRVERVAARSFSADRTVAVRAGLETDYATPAARTMPMGLRVAAPPG